MNNPRILLVDDESSGLESLQRIFSDDDFDVEAVSDGQTALERARTLKPDVVLLDVHMPGMTGLQVCRTLREDPTLAEMGIILVTGIDDRESRLAGLDAGADDFVAKPFDPAELRLRVRNQLELGRFRQLTEERDRFDRLFNQAPEAVVLVDDEGIIRLANQKAVGILGGPGQPPAGRSLFELMDRESRVRWHQLLPLAIQEPREESTLEAITLTSPRGTMDFDAHVGSTVLSGTPMAQILFRPRRRELTASDPLLTAARLTPITRVTRAVIHDFNNLWQTVRVNAELMAMDQADGSEAQRDLEEIMELADRGAELGRTLVDYVRGEAEGEQAVSISEALAQSRGLLELLAGKAIELEFREGAAVPSVCVDPMDFREILVELVVNARDAIGDGRGSIRIETIGRKVDGRAMAGFRLVDEGGGAEAVENMFEPGYTTRPGRRGIGLAAVRATIDDYEGRVTAQNVDGGLEVEVLLPTA